jgi:hypothetical protein
MPAAAIGRLYELVVYNRRACTARAVLSIAEVQIVPSADRRIDYMIPRDDESAILQQADT